MNNNEEKTEPEQEIEMPICPYCNKKMEPIAYEGYYDSFDCWECECDDIPGATKLNGQYA